MATTTGPLMSLDASGTIAKTITFAKWKGRNYVRTRVIPHNPKTATQTATRAMMRFLTQIWAAIPVDPTTWMPLADSKKISPFNEFVSYNLSQFTQFLFPSDVYPAPRVMAGVAIAAQTSVGGVRQIVGQATIGTNTNSWAVAFAVSTNTGFTPARNNIALILEGVNQDVVDYTLVGLPAGSYFVRTANLNLDGSIGAWHAQTTATVTA